MTYEQYRKFGYVSRLCLIRGGGGPSGSTVNAENALMANQASIANQATSQEQQQLQQMQTLEAPLIAQETALAGGDRTAALAASMPTISKISQGYDASKQSIGNTIAPGAARDTALAQLEVQKNTGIAGTQAQMVQQAPSVLAALGQSQGQMSLQSLGAALSGFSGASQTNQAAGQLETQQSNAFWSPILGLAAAGGSAIGGTDFKKGSCWIAEAIYGVDDERTHIARAWLNGPFRSRWFGRVVMSAYLAVGERVAAVVRRSAPLRAILKPLFDRAVAKGREAYCGR
jgi:hypothetical protein